MSDSFDRKLRLDERCALRGHLLACPVCPKLRKQLRLVVQASRHRDGGDMQQHVIAEISTDAATSSTMHLSEASKKRIKESIRAAEDSRD